MQFSLIKLCCILRNYIRERERKRDNVFFFWPEPEYHLTKNAICFEQNPHGLDEPRLTWRMLVRLAGYPVRLEPLWIRDFVFQGLQTGPDVEPHEMLAYDAVLTANKSSRCTQGTQLAKKIAICLDKLHIKNKILVKCCHNAVTVMFHWNWTRTWLCCGMTLFMRVWEMLKKLLHSISPRFILKQIGYLIKWD